MWVKLSSRIKTIHILEEPRQSKLTFSLMQVQSESSISILGNSEKWKQIWESDALFTLTLQSTKMHQHHIKIKYIYSSFRWGCSLFYGAQHLLASWGICIVEIHWKMFRGTVKPCWHGSICSTGKILLYGGYVLNEKLYSQRIWETRRLSINTYVKHCEDAQE